MSTDRCDQEIFDHGKAVCTFHADQKTTEAWVQKVAKESGQRVDWAYFGGRVVVRFIGDYAAVRATVERLNPELEAACKQPESKWPLSAWMVFEP